MRLARLILLASIAIASISTASAGLLGVNFTGTLFDVDPATGALSNPRSTGAATALAGIALNPAGTALYGVNAGTNGLFMIDPVTGAATLVGPTGVDVIEGDMAFGPTGTLYGAYTSSSNLLSFNLTTGAATVLGPMTGLDDVSALAFNPAGILYALSSEGNVSTTPRLATINPATGAVLTNVATTGLGALGFIAGMTFDATGTLYLAGANSFYTLNPVTGAATFVGAQNADLSGLAFVPDAAVPEPSTLVLAGMALGLLGMRRRQHGQTPA